MDWKKLGKTIAKVGAPLLGTAVGGPAGGAIGTLVASVFGADPGDPEAIARAIQGDPEAAVKLREIETKYKVRLEELAVKRAEIESEEQLGTLQEVNKTMREEGRSDKWPVYSWRPFNGFCFPVAVMTIYFVLPFFERPVPSVPDWVWIGWLSILGVAVWGRNKEKLVKAGEIPKPGVISNVITAIQRGGK